MQGVNQTIQIALIMAAQSLEVETPYSIDQCLNGCRFIIEFTGKDDYVGIATSEFLDSDWELDIKSTAILTSELNCLIDIRNKEYSMAIKQAKEIMEDRMSYY